MSNTTRPTLAWDKSLIASFLSWPRQRQLEFLNSLPEPMKDQVLVAFGAKPKPPWTPWPNSPQERAYYSPADELFYGGAAGGGKSDLLIGLAGTKHLRAVIFRREFPRLRAIIDRSREIFTGRAESRLKDSFNEGLHVWRLQSEGVLEFASIQYEKDKENQRGRPRDFYGWDELTEFTESQFRFVNAWNRSTKPGQRCRVVATGNPPTSSEGEWVIRYWAPWLDSQHPNPAEPGELRWFARIEDKDVEVENGAPIVRDGETIQPRSRTFIPAKLSDNPALAETGYRAVLQAMPEPLRSQMLYGDFSIGVGDDPWQTIPTAWVRAAMSRWTAERPSDCPSLTAVGVDVARGGADKTVLSKRYGRYFPALEKHPGSSTPDGPSVVNLVVRAVLENPHADVNVDVIGVGSSVYDGCRQKRLRAVPVNVASAERRRDRAGVLTFANLRSYAYWLLRDSLDPAGGDELILPPDPELLADLTTPRWRMTPSGVRIEPKEDIIARIGRSPDCGDAVVLARLEMLNPLTVQGDLLLWPDGGTAESRLRADDRIVDVAGRQIVFDDDEGGDWFNR